MTTYIELTPPRSSAPRPCLTRCVQGLVPRPYRLRPALLPHLVRWARPRSAGGAPPAPGQPGCQDGPARRDTTAAASRPAGRRAYRWGNLTSQIKVGVSRSAFHWAAEEAISL